MFSLSRAGSLPISLSSADYSFHWHFLTLSFETNAGSTEFVLVFDNGG